MNQPRRSKLKLVREVYIKVKADEKDYYVKEKVYASRWDADIKTEHINEEIYDKAVSENKGTEVMTFEGARLNIKNEIFKLRRIS